MSEREENECAAMLVELAFLLPKGTNAMEHSAGKQLIRYVDAVRESALHGSEAGPQPCQHCGHLPHPLITESVVTNQPGHPVSAVCVLTHCQHMGEAGPQEAREELHRDCHDLVCNGDRRKPRGTAKSGCSCYRRDERAAMGSEAGVSARVLELARRGAYHDHQQLTLLQGHSGPKSFDTCSHPNCVLVRAALGVSPAAAEKE